MTEVEFIHKSLHSYRNIQCSTLDEFNDDLNRIILIRKLFLKYKISKEIPYRLALNYITILFNVFGDSTLELLLYKIPEEYYPQLFPFLLILNRLPDNVSNLYNVDLDMMIVGNLGSI